MTRLEERKQKANDWQTIDEFMLHMKDDRILLLYTHGGSELLFLII